MSVLFCCYLSESCLWIIPILSTGENYLRPPPGPNPSIPILSSKLIANKFEIIEELRFNEMLIAGVKGFKYLSITALPSFSILPPTRSRFPQNCVHELLIISVQLSFFLIKMWEWGKIKIFGQSNIWEHQSEMTFK